MFQPTHGVTHKPPMHARTHGTHSHAPTLQDVHTHNTQNARSHTHAHTHVHTLPDSPFCTLLSALVSGKWSRETKVSTHCGTQALPPHTCTHTHVHTHNHTMHDHTHDANMHIHTVTRAHTYTHTVTRARTHRHTHTHYLSLTNTHTLSHTHTHSHGHALPDPPCSTSLSALVSGGSWPPPPLSPTWWSWSARSDPHPPTWWSLVKPSSYRVCSSRASRSSSRPPHTSNSSSSGLCGAGF